jgi:hypothetical protein
VKSVGKKFVGLLNLKMIKAANTSFKPTRNNTDLILAKVCGRAA